LIIVHFIVLERINQKKKGKRKQSKKSMTPDPWSTSHVCKKESAKFCKKDRPHQSNQKCQEKNEKRKKKNWEQKKTKKQNQKEIFDFTHCTQKKKKKKSIIE